MDSLPNISHLNTVRNLLAGLSVAVICGSTVALFMPREAASTITAQEKTEAVESDSFDAGGDIVYLGQLPDRLRSLSSTEATPAVFRPASLSQSVQEPVAVEESPGAATDQPVEAQVFEPISTEPAEDSTVARPYDDANVQFEISEQTESSTAKGVEVSKEAVVHLQQSPATVSIPVNVTVNNGDVLGQLESLRRQVELLTKRLEASEAALAEARASAAAVKPPQVTLKPSVPAVAPGVKSTVTARPARPRVQRPAPPVGSVQIEYFPAAGAAADQPLLPGGSESVPGSPPPAVPDGAVSVPGVSESADSAPVLPELVPSDVGAEAGGVEAAEQAAPLIPAEPVQPQSSLPRATIPVTAAVAVKPVVAVSAATVPGVPSRTVSVARAAAPHSAPELRYENWTNPGVPQQAPAWGGTVSRSPVAAESVVKRAYVNVREGVEETFDRLPTADLRAPEWMRSIFRRSAKSVSRGGSGTSAKPAAVSAEVHRGVIVRPASHLQPGPPRQGSVSPSATGLPAQRAGVR